MKGVIDSYGKSACARYNLQFLTKFNPFILAWLRGFVESEKIVKGVI